MMAAIATRWTVLVTAPRACQAIDTYRDRLSAAGCQVIAHPALERLDEDELLPLVGDIDAIVCGDDRITARVLAAAPRLRVIAKWGTGIDSIDRDAARARGIAVCNTPDAFSDPVADTVMGYVLLFARRLDGMASDMSAGAWSRRQLRALSECTIGIVGFGNIGAAVARRAAAFRMRILACDAKPIGTGDPAIAAPGVTIAPIDQLLAESDFVTIHADLRPDNRHMIDARRLALLRPSAVLINTARGPLVDEEALISALREGRLAGAALDVFEHEPLPATSPLRHMPHVYLAPHNANSSAAAAERVHANTIRCLLEALTGVTQS
jgi:D-3-phosphoglycerate dehydrogenase / 2-oxoglutarate reductase